MKRSWFTALALYLAMLTLLISCQSGTSVEPNTLLAVKVNQVPLDHQAEIWAKAPRLEAATVSVAQENAPPGPLLWLQAVYDGQSIAFRLEWEDPTESIYKNAWTWDGNSFVESGDEDRLMIHFPIANDPEFASKGCGAICHSQEDDPEKWYMAANSKEFSYDQWYWKSTRTNPVGQADDKWLGQRADPLDTLSAHYADAQNGGGDERNLNDSRDGPAFVNANDSQVAFILAGQETAIDVNNLSLGTVIPGYILAPYTGSRGDVQANGVWSDGKWVLVLVRALNTGHPDDLVLIPQKPVPFGVALSDNDGGLSHLVVADDVLTLQWK